MDFKMKCKEEFCIMPRNSKYNTKRTSIYSHQHEVLYGLRNRKKSIDDGLIVFLRPEMHNMSKQGVHFNKTFDIYLKKIAEKVWLEYYEKTVEDFIERYGKNYL